METNQPGDVSNARIMESIGKLTGTVETMSMGLNLRIQDIRQDIRRLEESQNERMTQMEAGFNKRIDSVSTRVTALENEDKKMIEKIAKISVMGGGVSGALAAAAVILLKAFAH
jgi:uncharacterized protein YlxW (UPF0749 family)